MGVTLSKEEQDNIDSKIKAINTRTGKYAPKNTILDIAKALNVDVFLVDFDHKFPLLKHDVSGMIEYLDPKGNEKAKIFLNVDDIPERRSFTLAHELGHYILHKADVNGRFRLDYQIYTDNQQSKEETEANYFAASILVPKEKLLDIMKEIDVSKNISHVADYFGVSVPMLKRRILWIKTNQ